MTDINPEIIIDGYNKYLSIRFQMGKANKKYRATEHGKEKIKIAHKLWIDNKKNDTQYRLDINTKAKVNYHKRKEKKKILEANIALVVCLGEMK
jgi:hypothetical protein